VKLVGGSLTSVVAAPEKEAGSCLSRDPELDFSVQGRGRFEAGSLRIRPFQVDGEEGKKEE
jgi:hypothetical protein